MTTIRHLVRAAQPSSGTGDPGMNPLTEDGALLEAQVLDVELDLLRSRAAVLFELRVALGPWHSNTGLLVADGVSAFTWCSEKHQSARTAWNVLGSTPRSTGSSWEMRIETYPDAELFLRSRNATYYGIDVPSLSEIPDYGEVSEEELRSMVAGWDSTCTVDHVVVAEHATG